MDIKLLKHLGNIDQIAGIQESTLLRGRGEHIHVAEVYNAAGLRFTVVPDRGMDLFHCSYKGMNLSFQSKNGLTSPQSFSPKDNEFCDQWSGGMLVTCGLDNVGIQCESGGTCPTHGRFSYIPAKTFGTETKWEEEDYILRLSGQVDQTRLYGRHLSLCRTVETGLNSRSIKIWDKLTNFDAADEPYMLLYHINFGYPLVQEGTCMQVSGTKMETLAGSPDNYSRMEAPRDDATEELYLHTGFGKQGVGVIYNEKLELGAYVAFDAKNLPNMLQWKLRQSHNYVVAFEPSNTCGLNRSEATQAGKIAVLPAYETIENTLEIGVLDGLSDIRQFIKNI
jgi:hypothetical protein